jgi:hypothetical protein
MSESLGKTEWLGHGQPPSEESLIADCGWKAPCQCFALLVTAAAALETGAGTTPWGNLLDYDATNYLIVPPERTNFAL